MQNNVNLHRCSYSFVLPSIQSGAERNHSSVPININDFICDLFMESARYRHAGTMTSASPIADTIGINLFMMLPPSAQ